MSTLALLQKLSGLTPEVEASLSFTGASLLKVSESIADEATDEEIIFSVDVSALQVAYIVSDQDVTLDTNSSGAPDETIELLANNPYVWYLGSYYANLLATDITSVFITNASGSTAEIDFVFLTDPTP
jgi:hypothetical protein